MRRKCVFNASLLKKASTFYTYSVLHTLSVCVGVITGALMLLPSTGAVPEAAVAALLCLGTSTLPRVPGPFPASHCRRVFSHWVFNCWLSQLSCPLSKPVSPAIESDTGYVFFFHFFSFQKDSFCHLSSFSCGLISFVCFASSWHSRSAAHSLVC